MKELDRKKLTKMQQNLHDFYIVREELCLLIEELGFSYTEIAKKIKLQPKTFCKKLKERSFSGVEVQKLYDYIMSVYLKIVKIKMTTYDDLYKTAPESPYEL